MSVWDDLVATALLGTERAGADAVVRTPDAGRDQPNDGTSSASTPLALLEQAAALTVYRRAGTRSREAAPGTTAPAPPERRARCPAPAASRLSLMLAGTHRPFLPESLARIDARGERVPEELLPQLLDLGRWSSAERDAIGPVLGERGRWLAAQHIDWRWALTTAGGTPLVDAAEVAERFRLGTFEERLVALADWRALDPDAARAALIDTWDSETSEHRPRLLEMLAPQLAAADEPFLEQQLDARTKPVRAGAAALLVALPGSGLRRRMAERAADLLQWSSGIRARVRVVLPAAFTPDMARDGIVERPPKGTGEKAWWLDQILAATPLDLWTSSFGRTPQEIFATTVADDWAPVVHHALARAAIAQREVAWLRAAATTVPIEQAGDVFAALPSDDAAELLLPRVRAEGVTPAVLHMLARLTASWTVELSDAVLDAILDLLRHHADGTIGKVSHHAVPPSFVVAAAPAVIPRALAELAALDRSGADDNLRRFAILPLITALQFRHELIEELP